MPEKPMPRELALEVERVGTQNLEKVENGERSRLDFFVSDEDTEAYGEWRKNIPKELRLVVEAGITGKEVLVDKNSTPLVRQFLSGFQELLKNPLADLQSLALDSAVQNNLEQLRAIKTGENEEFSIFNALKLPDIGFASISNLVQNEVSARLDWLQTKDIYNRERRKPLETEIDLQPSDEPDEYTPNRAEQEKGEEMPAHALALINEFYGGYYRDGAFDEFDPVTLKWSKRKARVEMLKDQEIDLDKARYYRGSVSSGGRSVIKLPDGWGIDKNSIEWDGEKPENVDFIGDDFGIVSIQTSASEDIAQYSYKLKIGPSVDALHIVEPEKQIGSVEDNFPDELFKEARKIMQEKGSKFAKARRIVSFIRGNLEYSLDYDLEAKYKANPAKYFESIWGEGKAKCDEANTMACRTLQKFGFDSLFISGHSAQEKTDDGSAILHDNNRHAWTMVYDHDFGDWRRLDATPKGDPNVDEQEQDEELGEGDYANPEEVELMSEEEFEERKRNIQSGESEELKESAEVRFAKEAECSVEEAQRVLKLVERLRSRYSDTLENSRAYWQGVVRKNFKIVEDYRGPVTMSRGDILEDVVDARIDIKSGENDPIGWERLEKETAVEKLFGGFDLYVAVDLSGSMNDTINGESKVDSQRDMVFLLMDSVMSAAAHVRGVNHKLKTPMPVRVSLAVFGSNTEISIPLTDSWGPAEQIKVYRALDSGAGGGTPDDVALGMIEKDIANEIDAKQGDKKSDDTRRLVIVVADGGSNSPADTKRVNDQFAKDGIPVDIFLIANDDDDRLVSAVKDVYQEVSVVSDPSNLAKQGVERVTTRLKQMYGE